MTQHALLFTLSAVGISETSYLIRKRIEQGKPLCVVGQECHKVLESEYNKTFGIHNDILGFMFYITVSSLTALLVIDRIVPQAFLDFAVEILILSGALMSTYFIYIQWKTIKVWCFWCLISALTIFLMMIIVITSSLAV